MVEVRREERAMPTRTDEDLLEALNRGEQEAFSALVRRYHAQLVRVARAFVRSEALAEEVAQEVWLHVVKGLERFEGRSSFKTWLFAILRNRAKTRGTREDRSRPFSALGSADGETKFGPDTLDPRENWFSPPSFAEMSAPDEDVLRTELFGEVEKALENLPESQRTVVTMRDLLGWSSAEVQEALEISEANQRVLLHRGRARLRKELAGYMASALD